MNAGLPKARKVLAVSSKHPHSILLLRVRNMEMVHFLTLYSPGYFETA